MPVENPRGLLFIYVLPPFILHPHPMGTQKAFIFLLFFNLTTALRGGLGWKSVTVPRSFTKFPQQSRDWNLGQPSNHYTRLALWHITYEQPIWAAPWKPWMRQRFNNSCFAGTHLRVLCFADLVTDLGLPCVMWESASISSIHYGVSLPAAERLLKSSALIYFPLNSCYCRCSGKTFKSGQDEQSIPVSFLH